MTNAHASKQHGVTTHNTTRPKSKLRKRNNKHRSVARKAEIIAQRRAAVKGGKVAAPVVAKVTAKVAAPAKKAPAKKAAPKKAAAKAK